MHRVDTATALDTLPAVDPAGSPGYFTKGDPQQGVPATIPGQDWFNAVQEEMLHILDQAAIAPVKGTFTQVFDSLETLYWSPRNDGPGSTLDADTLDGLHSFDFQVGKVTTDSGSGIREYADWNDTYATGFYQGTDADGVLNQTPYKSHAWQYTVNFRHTIDYAMQIASGFEAEGQLSYRKKAGGSWNDWLQIWGASNDGPGSGLDADLWDGNQFDVYLNQPVRTDSDVSFETITAKNKIEVTAYPSGNAHLYLEDETGAPQGLLYWNRTGGRVQLARRNDAGTAWEGQLWIDGDAPTDLVFEDLSGPQTVWTSGNDGTSSGLDADTLRALVPGNASGNIPVSNGTLCSNLNADLLRGNAPGNASGYIPLSNGTRCTDLNADMLDGYHASDFALKALYPAYIVQDKTWVFNDVAPGAEVNAAAVVAENFVKTVGSSYLVVSVNMSSFADNHKCAAKAIATGVGMASAGWGTAPADPAAVTQSYEISVSARNNSTSTHQLYVRVVVLSNTDS